MVGKSPYAITLVHGHEHDGHVSKPIITKVIGSSSHLDGATGQLFTAHHVTTASGNVTTLEAVPGEHELDHASNTQRINKKNGPIWGGVTFAHVEAGVTKHSLGDKTRYVVPQVAPDGTKNALHQMLTLAEADKNFYGGKYNGAKGKCIGTGGDMCYNLEAEHYKDMTAKMKTALRTDSHFAHSDEENIHSNGLGIHVTRLGTATNLEGADMEERFGVHLTLNRTPTDPLTGAPKAAPNKITTRAHIGAISGVKGSSGAVVGAPKPTGAFAKEISEDPSIASKIVVSDILSEEAA
jgi:hypothetical protein